MALGIEISCPFFQFPIIVLGKIEVKGDSGEELLSLTSLGLYDYLRSAAPLIFAPLTILDKDIPEGLAEAITDWIWQKQIINQTVAEMDSNDEVKLALSFQTGMTLGTDDYHLKKQIEVELATTLTNKQGNQGNYRQLQRENQNTVKIESTFQLGSTKIATEIEMGKKNSKLKLAFTLGKLFSNNKLLDLVGDCLQVISRKNSPLNASPSASILALITDPILLTTLKQGIAQVGIKDTLDSELEFSVTIAGGEERYMAMEVRHVNEISAGEESDLEVKLKQGKTHQWKKNLDKPSRQSGKTAPKTASEKSITINFAPRADQSVVSSYTIQVLKDVLKAAGETKALITRTSADAHNQARIMYQNLETKGVESEKELYGRNGDKVIDVYVTAKNAGKTPDQIKRDMESEINKLGPANVSKHCADHQMLGVVDIAPDSLSDSQKFEAAVKAEPRISRYFFPPKDRAYHLEIPQPN